MSGKTGALFDSAPAVPVPVPVSEPESAAAFAKKDKKMIKSVKSTHTHTHSKLITTHTHALDERVAVAAEAAVVVVGVSADFDAAPPLRPPAVATLTAAAGVLLLSTVNRKANGRRALLNTRHPEGTTPVTTTFGM